MKTPQKQVLHHHEQKTIDLNDLDQKSKKKKKYKHATKKKQNSSAVQSSSQNIKTYELGYYDDKDEKWRDKAVLFLQKQGILDQYNKLTEHGMLHSHVIKHIEELKNTDTVDFLRKVKPYGKWRKCATDGKECDCCKGLLEVHFYMDYEDKTLCLDRDYKVTDNLL